MLFTADWVAYSVCISILEQHFVFTEVSSCLLSHLYWLLLAHQCFFNFSISVESPFPLCICLLILVASYSLSLMVFLPSVLLIHWALLCPEFHLLSFFPTPSLYCSSPQVTCQDRVWGRIVECLYISNCALILIGKFDGLWNSRLKFFLRSLWMSDSSLRLTSSIISSICIIVIYSLIPRLEAFKISTLSLVYSVS